MRKSPEGTNDSSKLVNKDGSKEKSHPETNDANIHQKPAAIIPATKQYFERFYTIKQEIMEKEQNAKI